MKFTAASAAVSFITKRLLQYPMIKFLGWDKPAVDLVAEQLLAGLNHPDTADAFRRATVIVPTAESGRRLRERIAELAARPVLIPHVTQAAHLVAVSGAAGEMTEFAAWIKVFASSPAHECWPSLFPQKPVNQQSWSYGMARQLMQLRRRLEDACLSPERIAADFDEEHDRNRWLEIGTIFGAVDDCLAEWGYKPAAVCYAAAQREALAQYAGRTIILACVAQLSARIRLFLDAVVAAGGRVLVYVNAPVAVQHLFDACYGLPLNAWGQEKFDISDDALRVVPDGVGMAAAALQECEGLESNRVVLGCCDASFVPGLRNAFDYAGWPLNMPEGRSFMSTAAGQWLAALIRALARSDSVVAVEPLLRNECMQRCMRLGASRRYQFNRWLDDELSKNLPSGMLQLLSHASRSRDESAYIPAYTEKVRDMLVALKREESLPDTLNSLAGALQHAYQNDVLAAAVGQLAEMLQQVAVMAQRIPEFASAPAALGLSQSYVALQAQGGLGVVSTLREESALDASGWMELPYCSGLKLILCGLHEHCVPEPPSVDAFLPESLCRRYPQLGGMEQRVARDSFMLRALLGAYGESLRIIVARQSDDGTPIIPSQLLLRCPAEPADLLLKRVSLLFTELAPVREAVTPGVWRMHTPDYVLPGLEDVSLLGAAARNPWNHGRDYFSPSVLAAFLSCPLRFWLKYALQLDPQDVFDPGKTALDAMEYGTAMHSVLEALVRRFPSLAPEATPEAMRLYAEECIQKQFQHYGEPLSLPLAAQRRMMEGNVGLFIDAHLADLADGWENVHLEYRTQESGWMLDGKIPFHMTVDRVDRRPKVDGSGYCWRIIDYKTGSSKPKEKHLAKTAEETTACFQQLLPELPLLPLPNRKGEPELYRWKEVQLPLYAQWLMDTYQVPVEDIEVAYYLMPRNKKLCSYEKWKLDEEMQENALTWVRAAVQMIRDGRCLLSAESLGLTAYADFGALAPDGDPRTMMGLPEINLN